MQGSCPSLRAWVSFALRHVLLHPPSLHSQILTVYHNLRTQPLGPAGPGRALAYFAYFSPRVGFAEDTREPSSQVQVLWGYMPLACSSPHIWIWFGSLISSQYDFSVSPSIFWFMQWSTWKTYLLLLHTVRITAALGLSCCEKWSSSVKRVIPVKENEHGAAALCWIMLLSGIWATNKGESTEKGLWVASFVCTNFKWVDEGVFRGPVSCSGWWQVSFLALSGAKWPVWF